MKKIYCVSCLIFMFVVVFIGVSFAENKVSEPQVTEAEFRDALRKALAGDPKEQAFVGGCYLQGLGCKSDDIAGILWLTKAAQQGEKTASVMLDICQLLVDPNNAIRLAAIYYDGKGVTQDFKLSAMWACRAAELGLFEGQLIFGAMCALGTGVDRDLVKAHMWYNIAASIATGSQRQNAILCREEVAEQMTAEQIQEAQKLASNWKAKK